MSFHLLQTTDAQEWAKEFMKIWGGKLHEVDEGLMISWFANAIMTGSDHYRWAREKETCETCIRDEVCRIQDGSRKVSKPIRDFSCSEYRRRE